MKTGSPKFKVEASKRLSRREFVRVAIGAAVAGSGLSCGVRGSPWRFLTVEEARTLASIADQIIPPDKYAGAAWAGVVNYIDCQLLGPFRHLRDTYRQGIAGVDQTSQALYAKRFVDLPSPKQMELLAQLEEGRASGEVWKSMSSREFFELLIDHTMQGFYGDPRHGGNRERTSWKMLRLPYPPIRGQAPSS